MPDAGTFPALERLQTEAEGMEVLIKHAPFGTAATIEWLFGLDYTERKQAILDRREEVRNTYQTHRSRIEQTYGSSVVRVLNRRADGDQPRFDIERMETELADATQEFEALQAAVDREYLTRSERKRLADLEADISTAHAYVSNYEAFINRRDRLEPTIEEFDELFEPYVGAEQYMISSDKARLETLSHEIWTELSALARELVLPELPRIAADWLAEQKTRFGELVDYLPDYNEAFVRNEREAYAELLETEHGPLNDQQQKAVIRNDRRNLVDASAGTGKTLTLTYRFIYLLEKGVPVDSIAAITYTRDAASEMKTRIAAATGADEDDLHISTIHSFARSIYQDAYSGDGSVGDAREELVEAYVTAAENGLDAVDADVPFPDCYAAFKPAYDEFMTVERDHGENGYIADNKGYTETREAFVRRKLDSFVEKARIFDLSAAQIRQRLDGTNEVRDTFGKTAIALVEAYMKRVENEQGPTDFDDMIETATRIIRKNPERFGDQYAHILVDEFQDITDSTLSFVESFMGGDSETHLFCVGDDWQGIYGFNGSNIRYFTDYDEQFADVTYTQLEVNYRCPPAIVEAGSALMAQSSAPQNDKAVEADKDLETTPTVHVLDTLYEARVVPYVADMVESEYASRQPDEIMVLSRNDSNSTYMKQLRKELEARNIPHRRPKYEEDYLPEEYVETLDFDVTYDDEGFVEYDVPKSVEPPEESPPIVRTQSVHSSKGTEAPVVILLHGVDDDPDGIPIKQRTDPLVDPATQITADHIAEERRLFYVALTRTEEEFHAVTKADSPSRYLLDIEQRFDWQAVALPTEFVGRCTEYSEPDQSNYPIKATLDCGAFELPLLSWPNQNPLRLTPGATYRLELTDPDTQINENEYGTEIRFDRTPIERVEKSVSAEQAE